MITEAGVATVRAIVREWSDEDLRAWEPGPTAHPDSLLKKIVTEERERRFGVAS